MGWKMRRPRMHQNGSHKERERYIKCMPASAVGKYIFWFCLSVGSIDKDLFFIECMSNGWSVCCLMTFPVKI